jgi:hypothetical protein
MATTKRVKRLVRLTPHVGRSHHARPEALRDLHDLDLAKRLDGARRRRDGYMVTYWRQLLTATSASRRAEAGDRTAARRMAWREGIIEVRSRMHDLLMRFEALEGEITRMIRRGPPCVWCSHVLEQRRQRRDEVVTKITGLLANVVTWREHRRRDEATARDADAWLRRQLAGLGK